MNPEVNWATGPFPTDGAAMTKCPHGTFVDESCCQCGRGISDIRRFSKDQARDLLLNQASIYGTAQELARMADSQGQHEITENIVKSLERAVLSAAELYYELQIKP